jgi:hypothetical protein
VSAPLADFLSIESHLALDKIEAQIACHYAERALGVALFPGPAPEPMTTPPTLPDPTVVTKMTVPKLVRLRIDYVHVARKSGEACPTCQTVLRYSTIIYPGGVRPSNMPESGWHCGRCRQYYVYQAEPVAMAAEKAS